MFMHTKPNAGGSEESLVDKLIFRGGARARNVHGRGTAYLPQGNHRYFTMSIFRSGVEEVRLFKVYLGPQKIDGCKTYKKEMGMQADTLYKLPDSINEIVFEL